ncbi:MAG: outer membrane lipoprotein LolB [Proteobacteria bacterium]|nr:outer membrane lipoprotein LolB [Pseudomonadota bacterium]MBK9251588.1 outer membrane lipoprotein LolB [Pseudomonadota bacterium]
MSFTSRMRLAFGVLLAFALLAACATRPPAIVLLDPARQAALLRELPAYTLEGRVAVRSGEEGWQASVRWRQRGEVSEVRLSGPFGAGALQLRFDGAGLTVTTSNGQVLAGDDATLALRQQLGFDPPLAELRRWLLADAAPPEASARVEVGANGRPATLQQQDWQIAFEDYRAQTVKGATVQMPRRIIATRADVRLRLVVDRWQLGKGR